ncbi:unnamed protein product [Leptidea sinapis]|uniref:C2H2-type domain-containing protein n=1 Tax=Leptidea sinapis TaxID=189913 RepID=A0A5E4QYZ7_9NEOP|nr:unnamed protein product [Leptidea sinapis]
MEHGCSVNLHSRNKNKLPCDFCNKTFSTRYDVLVHNASHIIIPLINITTHHCDVCHCVFLTSKELSCHEESHTESSPAHKKQIKLSLVKEKCLDSVQVNPVLESTSSAPEETDDVKENAEDLEVKSVVNLEETSQDSCSVWNFVNGEQNFSDFDVKCLENDSVEYILPDDYDPSVKFRDVKTTKDDEISVLYDDLVKPNSCVCKYCGWGFHTRFNLIKHLPTHIRFKRNVPSQCWHKNNLVKKCEFCDLSHTRNTKSEIKPEPVQELEQLPSSANEMTVDNQSGNIAPRKRGRPRKIISIDNNVENQASNVQPKKRGRPRKIVGPLMNNEDVMLNNKPPKTEAVGKKRTRKKINYDEDYNIDMLFENVTGPSVVLKNSVSKGEHSSVRTNCDAVDNCDGQKSTTTESNVDYMLQNKLDFLLGGLKVEQSAERSQQTDTGTTNIHKKPKKLFKSAATIRLCDICTQFLPKQGRSNYKYHRVGTLSKIGERFPCDECKKLFFTLNLISRYKVMVVKSKNKLVFEDETCEKKKKKSNEDRLKNIQTRFKFNNLLNR